MQIRAWMLGMVLLGLAAPAGAGPQEIAAAVADPARSAELRALDGNRKPQEVLEFSGIGGGQTVVDFMAGDGYYSELIASVVGAKGSVLAVNPAAFHNASVWQALQARHRNIRTMGVEPRAMLIAPGSADVIFAHLVFHDLYWESEQYRFPRLDVPFVLANWYAALKPGGSVIVVDHAGPAGDTREITRRLHRIDPQTVVAAMQRAGFVLEAQSIMLHRSDDDQSRNVFDAEVRGKTDRFVMKFRKISKE